MAIGSIGCSGDYALEMSQLAQASQAQPVEVTLNAPQAPVEQIDNSAQPEIATKVDLLV